MPATCPPVPESRRWALAVAALVSAASTYYVLWAGRVMAEAYDAEPGSLDLLAVPFVREELGARFRLAAVVALAATVTTLALGVRWLRRDRRGALVVVSLGLTVLLWVALAAFAVAGEWRPV
jgi:hypothetical protein